MAIKPTFERRHFNLIAETVKRMRKDAPHFGPLTHEQADTVTLEFTQALACTNPNFNRHRFKEACGWRSGS